MRLNDALFSPLDRREREELERLLLRVLAHHDERFAAREPRPAAPEDTGGPKGEEAGRSA